MTPVFCCGFECGQLGSSGQHWSSFVTGSIDTTIKRNGARSARVNISSGSTGGFDSLTLTSSNIWVGRFYIYFTTLPTVNAILFKGASANIGVAFNASDNKIYPGIAGNPITFGSTGYLVSVNRWYRVDVKIVTSANPHTCDVSVNGVTLAQLTNAVASASHTQVSVGIVNIQAADAGLNTTDLYIDDIILSNTSADYPIGNGYVSHFIPTSDGTHNVAGANDFEFSATGTDITNATTTAFTLIDDVPLKSGTATEYINLIAPPNATDYVEVVFGPASGVPTPKYGPRGIEAIVAHAASATGTNNIRIALNDNGTTDDIANGAYHASSAAISYHTKHYSDPPSAATVWGIASGNGNFNNVRMRCFTNDAAPDPWWASAMIEAEFAEWPQKITQVKQAVNRSNTY